MVNRRGLATKARKTRSSGNDDAKLVATRITVSPGQAYGGRAVPGKVPRGSFRPRRGEGVFSPLGRLILDKLDRGVMLLDAEGAVMDANTLAEKVLVMQHGLLVRNGRLAFVDAELDGRFARMIGHPERGVPRSIAARGLQRSLAGRVRPSGAGSFRVLVTAIGPQALAREAAYLVVLYAPGEQRVISREVLLELYGLTRAQADVARRLYAGYSVEETAAELELSLNTVRTHLKHIFSKCEVQSQAELLHTFALGPQSL
jgi:DNA-binding CsgD family transcriptional regulator